MQLWKSHKVDFLTKNSLNMFNAMTTARYYEIYKMYVCEHHLPDDSKTITVTALHNFIHQNLDADEIEEYLQRAEHFA